jgi:hypothetical protein
MSNTPYITQQTLLLQPPVKNKQQQVKMTFYRLDSRRNILLNLYNKIIVKKKEKNFEFQADTNTTPSISKIKEITL